MEEVKWAAIVILVLIVTSLLGGVIRRGALLPSWLVEWRWLANFVRSRDRKRVVLDCYGSSFGFHEGEALIDGTSMPTTQGVLHGVFIRVTCTSRFWSRSTIVMAEQPSVVDHIEITRGAWATGLRSGATGDAAFDRAFLVRAPSSGQIDSWLTPSLRAQLLAFGVVDVTLTLGAGRVTFILRGYHLNNFAVLDGALMIALTAALRRPVTALRSTAMPLAEAR